MQRKSFTPTIFETVLSRDLVSFNTTVYKNSQDKQDFIIKIHNLCLSGTPFIDIEIEIENSLKNDNSVSVPQLTDIIMLKNIAYQSLLN